MDILLAYYPWIKSFHIISVIAWMAGLLYLPRLFIYHCQAIQSGSSGNTETFKVMEAKLLRIIMNPAMILTWVFGLIMIAAQPNLFEFGWMHVKMTCVILMSALHMVFAKWRRDFLSDQPAYTEKTYRIWNEAPAVLMVIIVIAAIAEPF